MKYGRILLLALAVVATAALAPLGTLAPTAEATLPSGAGCPATPGTGKAVWVVSATLPASAGQNANGVCIDLTGTGGENNTATLKQNAAGCGATVPTVGAGSSYVWADWGTTSCVAPGDTVIIQFQGIQSGSPPQVYSVKWNLANDTVIDGTGTSQHSYVGGLAALPDVAGSSGPNYALLGGLAAAALVALGAGGWYARRRWVR
jgi:hypothetical protein